MWQSTMIINLTNIDLDYLEEDAATNEVPKLTEKWASTLGRICRRKKRTFCILIIS